MPHTKPAPNSRTRTRRLLRTAAITAAAGAALTGALVGSAAAADDLPEFEIKIERDALNRSITAAKHRREYRQVYAEAKKLKVEPDNAALSVNLGPKAAKSKVDELEHKVRKAREPEFARPESLGVSSATLESIASCESGGNPAAVDASGTYRGKYQFDLGTWASVGGSGDPAAAPEEEQDYRAAMLYSRSGSSPWPICGS